MTVSSLSREQVTKWTVKREVSRRRYQPLYHHRPPIRTRSVRRRRSSRKLAATLMEFDSRNWCSLNTSSHRLQVAVDVDEVLGQFLVALNLFCEKHYGMRHNVDDYHVYHFATVWGTSQEQSNEIVHEFFKSPYFDQLPLVPGAFEALCEMQNWCDLHVVTSRQHVIKDITIKWLRRHYPGIFTSVHFGNHFALDGEVKRKSELCKAIDADVLIDDNPEYALDCALSGMHVILYNWGKSYPWSTLGERTQHARIREVQCWSVVPSTLREFQSVRRL
eukprot:g6791.t1